MIFLIAFIMILINNNVLVVSSNDASNLVTYMVHMERNKMEALEESLGSSRSWHDEIIESITISSSDLDHPTPAPQLLYGYNHVFSGFSARLTNQQLEYLKGVDGFLYASKDKLYTLQTTHSPQFLGLHEGKGLWSPGNLASDVIIGLVDTGIWPEHTSFVDTGYPPVPSNWKGQCHPGTEFKVSNCNRKLIGAAAFFKSYESEQGRINKTTDYRSARDSDGHGTHTASTAGGNRVGGANIFGLANGTAAGTSYTTRIASYKVCFSSRTFCYGSDIVAAMEQAVKDGVDVLSLSIGGGPGVPYYDDPIAIGAFGATKKGVIVSVSAGNDGPDSSTVTNGAPWLMTVAASYTDRSFPAQVTLGDGRNLTGDSLFSGNSTKMLPLVYHDTGNAKFCKSGSLSPGLVKDKIVICVRGGDARVAKGQVVKDAGGAGMILANNVTDGEETVADAHVLPALMLGFSEGDAVIKYTIKSPKNPKAKLIFQGHEAYGNRAPVMAAFSSRGPHSVDKYILKPDVTAPGVNILAAWPPNVSPTGIESDKRSVSFNILSGTSMSCPQVSGLMALLKSRHRDWSSAAIKSALMTTAYVRDSKNSPISDAGSSRLEPATPFAFGSGHVDPERASDPGLIYDISTRDYLNYLCGLNYNSTEMARVAGESLTCSAGSHFQPGDLNYPSFSVVFCKNFTGTTYKRTVTNVGIRGVSTYSVKVIQPKGISIIVKPKVLKFRKTGENLTYNVTFKVKKGIMAAKFSFGSLEWVSSDRKYSVRSPVAVTFM